MLHRNLDWRTAEGPLAAEPFVNHNTQGVLIAGWLRLALQYSAAKKL